MGKITVKHYLNTRLKPEVEQVGKKIYSYYPLYISITVNKKNIRCRSNLLNVWLTTEDFEKKGKEYRAVASLLQYERNLFTQITSLLVDDIANNRINQDIIKSHFGKQKSKDKFVSLLNSYLDCYSYSIFMSVDYYCNQMIENDVYNKLSQAFKLDQFSRIREVFKFNFPNVLRGDLVEFIKSNLTENSLKLYYVVEYLRHFLAPYALKTGYDIPYYDWLNNKIQPILKADMKEFATRHETFCGIMTTDEMIEFTVEVIDDVVKNHFIEYTELDRQALMLKFNK